jgi:type II secretory pathway pseudopilin PulG
MSKRRPGRESGFSLIEVMVAIGFLLVSSLVVGLALQAGIRSNRELREAQVLQARAQTWADRIVRQNFGQSFDPDPDAGQVEALFDCASAPGDITIQQLTRYPSADCGWRFTLTDFPVEGEWRVVVDRDLDGDGSVAGGLEEGARVLRIQVFFNDRLVLATSRAKEVTL